MAQDFEFSGPERAAFERVFELSEDFTADSIMRSVTSKDAAKAFAANADRFIKYLDLENNENGYSILRYIAGYSAEAIRSFSKNLPKFAKYIANEDMKFGIVTLR